MKWLELSSRRFEPIPDIQFSLKKPLFAASVVLKYWLSSNDPDAESRVAAEGPRVRALAELEAKIPLKGPLHYSIKVLGQDEPWQNVADRSGGAGASGPAIFAFEKVWERDEIAGRGRLIESGPLSYSITDVGGAHDGRVETVRVLPDASARLFSPLQLLPAFVQTHSTEREDALYGAYFITGKHIDALRLERVSAQSDALAQTKYDFHEETFEGRWLRVPRVLSEAEWAELPWSTRKPFTFTYHVAEKRITSAGIHLPIIGSVTIRA